MIPTNNYKYCNHHHVLTDEQMMVTIGGEKFIADIQMIPLLEALNGIGLKTRTHNYSEDNCFISILLEDNVSFEIRKIYERNSTRTKYNGKTELLISWKR